MHRSDSEEEIVFWNNIESFFQLSFLDFEIFWIFWKFKQEIEVFNLLQKLKKTLRGVVDHTFTFWMILVL